MERIIELLSFGKDLVFGFLLEFLLFGMFSLILAAFVFIPYYIYRQNLLIFNTFDEKVTKSVSLLKKSILLRNIK